MPLWELPPLLWLELGVLFVMRLLLLVDPVELRVSEPEVVPLVVSVPPVLVDVSRCDAQPATSAAAANKAIRYFIIIIVFLCPDTYSAKPVFGKMGAITPFGRRSLLGRTMKMTRGRN